jgi:ACR3 family arsenite efflux pump ArsB
MTKPLVVEVLVALLLALLVGQALRLQLLELLSTEAVVALVVPTAQPGTLAALAVVVLVVVPTQEA